MKKMILKIVLVLLALLVVWVVANQFDAKLNPDVFTMKEIPEASFGKANGFYILWSFHKPPEVDINSDAIREKYQKLFDPRWDNEKYIREYDYKKERIMFNKTFSIKFREIGILLTGVGDITRNDLCPEVESKKSLLSPLDPDLVVFYQRFRMMIDSPIFEDFVSLKADAPLPNLLAWLQAAKLYAAVNILTALEGEWEKGVSNLLDLTDFSKRAVKASRFLIFNLVSKGILQISLQSIASLMNRKECPATVFEMVLKRTPPIKFEEFGSRQSLICELLGFTHDFFDRPYKHKPYRFFNFWERTLLFFFLQENRTKNLANEYYKQYIELEQTPPYQWKSDTIRMKPFKTGPFWWLWNAGGKELLSSYINYGNGLHAVIYKSYGKKAIYDMVRISAELHLTYNPDKPVQEILNRLDSYKVLDACSGQPYKWNDEKQVLYSIGTDRTDNGGETHRYQRIEGTDYALPVILYLNLN
jgi:hypothetical protein